MVRVDLLVHFSRPMIAGRGLFQNPPYQLGISGSVAGAFRLHPGRRRWPGGAGFHFRRLRSSAMPRSMAGRDKRDAWLIPFLASSGVRRVTNSRGQRVDKRQITAKETLALVRGRRDCLILLRLELTTLLVHTLQVLLHLRNRARISSIQLAGRRGRRSRIFR